MSSTAIVAVAVLLIALSTSSAAGVLALGGGQQATVAPTSTPGGTQTQSQDRPQAVSGGAARTPNSKTKKPTAKTTSPPKVYSKQQCRDAVYRWAQGVQKAGAAATGGWFDASLGSEVKKFCGGCIKKDEAGLMFGKAIGVKRYPDQWDDTKISRVADDSFHQWVADYITSDLPGTCSSA
jgi:hypothetical protein